VLEGRSKKGTPFVIRYPKMSDLDALHLYINTLSREQSFIRFQGEVVGREEEKSFLLSQINKNNSHQTLFLLVFSKGSLIGVTDIEMLEKVEKHIGVLGITLAKEYRAEGIGRIALKTILAESISQLTELHIVTLGVFANNIHAIPLYEDMGFVEYGNLPEGIRHKGALVDHKLMYKRVR